ncbi:hypothetical protein JCM10213_002724 [Rhodosporidiobolus nylandii]
MDSLDDLQGALPEPATIHSLPPELVGEVLSHFFAVDDVHVESLKAASLVCRAWRDPAQTFVWQSGAELRSEEDIEAFVRTRHLRRTGPKEIAVHGYKDRRSLKKLFEVCDGLRWLMVQTPERDLDPKVLAVPQLRSLKTLIIQAWLTPFRPVVAFPFALRTLVLSDLSFRAPHMSTFLSSLQASCIPSLHSISLPSFSASAHPKVAEALVPFAPHLRHFGLYISLTADATPYIPFFHAATSLNSFECTSLPPALLANLPPSLTVLATPEDAVNLDGEELAKALSSLKRLKRLYFYTSRYEFLNHVKGARTMLEEMDARGVDWRFEGELED